VNGFTPLYGSNRKKIIVGRLVEKRIQGLPNEVQYFVTEPQHWDKRCRRKCVRLRYNLK